MNSTKFSIGIASLVLITPLVLGGTNTQAVNASHRTVATHVERPNANGALKSSVDFISPHKAYNQGVYDGTKDARYYNTHNGVEVNMNGKAYSSKRAVNEDWNDIYSEMKTEYRMSFERL